MRNKIGRLWLIPVALALVQCGGGSSESGGASASPGATRFSGVWTLLASLNVNIGGTATFFTDTSEVVVGVDGRVIIRQTDSECTLDITVNGDLMTYETRCIFTATNDDISAPCTLTLVARARIRGTPGTTSLSGSFGPDTLPCRGVAASYAGNLVGNRRGIDDETDMTHDMGTDTDTDMGTGDEA